MTDKQISFFKKLLLLRRSLGMPPTIRELQEYCRFSSPRSVMQFLDALEEAGVIKRGPGARNIRIVDVSALLADVDRTTTVAVPIVGHVAAGLPILAEENIEKYFSVSIRLAGPPHRYFLLRVHGDSMNRAGINNGDLALVRQQVHADPGDRVVALIDDHATIKRFHPLPDAVILEPVSSNPNHRPIVVDHDFMIQGVVLASLQESSPELHG